MIRFLALVLLLSASVCYAEDQVSEVYKGQLTFVYGQKSKTIKNLPRFEDYPSEKPSKEVAKDIDWNSHKSAWAFRTRLRKGLKSGPNFNGHYAVVTHGCGTSCQGNWIIDVTTGKVVGGMGTTYGVNYKLDSSLIVVQLPTNTADLDNEYPHLEEISFQKMENGKLKEVQSVMPFNMFLLNAGSFCEPACKE